MSENEYLANIYPDLQVAYTQYNVLMGLSGVLCGFIIFLFFLFLASRL